MSYRIGSFNCLNFGLGYKKNTQMFADIIYEENLDVIALQEIKRPEAVDMILKGLPNYWKGCHDSYGNFSSPNDYAYIWNTRRLKECSRDESPEVFSHIKSDNLIRKPYYGRFSPLGTPGGAFFEFRLIDTHLYYGSNNATDKSKRADEFLMLANEVYTRINKKRYGNNMPSYTIMLGDYNMTTAWCERQNIENQNIETFQHELTTLKSKENGFSNNYDHFTYDTVSFSGISANVSRINSVEKYYGNNYEKHREEISDHVPILIEINLV
jgi:endonuclease/exonuclease/phosphatase family metal-dependent hydrolase